MSPTSAVELITERVAGSGDLGTVYAAFVHDVQETAAAREQSLVLVLDGIDERPDDPAVRTFVRRILPLLAGAVVVVASARNVDVDLGPEYAVRKEKWLSRLSDDNVRQAIRDRTGLSGNTTEDLVTVIDGSAERLQNVITLYRTARVDPSDPDQLARFVAQVPAWADSGQVYEALGALDPAYRPLAFALSALRWVNRPLLEQVAAASAVLTGPDVHIHDLLSPELRPSWLVPDRWGWRIGNDRLRRAMLDEFSRSHPDVTARVHASAAEYHRRALWESGLDGAVDVPDDPLRVPVRATYDERRDDRATAYEAEWLYHLLAIDPRRAFPIALDRVAEAWQDGVDYASALQLLAVGADLDLPPLQQHMLRLISESISAELHGQIALAARLLEDALPLVPHDSPARALLLDALGTFYVNADRPSVALRWLAEALESAMKFEATDDRCRRAACLAAATQGLVLLERNRVSGTSELDEALATARETRDVRLIAAIHQMRVHAVASLGLARSEQAAREALGDIDAGLAADAAAAINVQLAFALMFKPDPDYAEADRTLDKALSTFKALGRSDDEIDVLCRKATLEMLRGDHTAASDVRAAAIDMSRTPALTHANLGSLAAWADNYPRALAEHWSACAHDALSRLSATGSNQEATTPAPADINVLLATFAADLDDLPRRTRFLAASSNDGGPRTADGKVLLAALRDGVQTPAVARRSLATSMLERLDGEPSFRYSLAGAMRWFASGGVETGAETIGWSDVVRALRTAGAAESDEPAEALLLADALQESDAVEEAERVRENIVAATKDRLAANPRDPELYAALGRSLHALQRSDEARDAYRHAYDLEPTIVRLVNLTDALTRCNQWTEASRLLEHVLNERGAEPALLDELVRLLTPVLDDEEQRRAERIARDQPDDSRFALIAGRGLASVIQKRAEARRAQTASQLSDQSTSIPSEERRELPVELLTDAVAWFTSAANLLGADRVPLLEAAELLLDVSDVAPVGAPTAWEVLEPVSADVIAAEANRDRAACALARIASRGGADEPPARMLLERLMQDAVAARTASLPELAPAVDVDIPHPFILLVGSGLVDRINPSVTPAAEQLYTTMIGAVREWARDELGFDVPGVSVRPADDGPGHLLAFYVHSVRREEYVLGGPAATTLGTDDVQLATGRPAPAGVLPDGRTATWLDDGQQRLLDELGSETFDMRGLVCLALLDAIPRRADEVLNTELVHQLLTSARVGDRWLEDGLGTAAAAFRRLVADGLPLADLSALMAGLDYPLDFAALYRETRQRAVAGSMVRPRGSQVVPLDDADVTELIGNATPMAVARIARVSLPRMAVERIRRWAAVRLPAGAGVVIVPDASDRIPVAELLRGAGLRHIVIAPSDIDATVSVP